MFSFEEDEPKNDSPLQPMRIPWKFLYPGSKSKREGQMLSIADAYENALIDESMIVANTILTQNMISDGVISMRDEDAKLSFEEKCKKYLGMDEESIKRFKDLLLEQEKKDE